ncbi:hypothetical protein JNW89_29300, partial [Micromonospora sp. 4G55]|nr:hypothetical protein [Micromonospora sp. 4G55]
MANPPHVRELIVDELTDAWQLGRHAFGFGPQPAPQAIVDMPGLTRYGAFDDTGRLLAKRRPAPRAVVVRAGRARRRRRRGRRRPRGPRPGRGP